MIPFSPPYIDDGIIEEVMQSLQSGWITTGPKVKKLEDNLSEYTGIPRVLCVNSWTSGAIMVFRWLGLQPDDEVIIPAYTYCATALSVIHGGGKPVMVDVGDDFNMNVEAVKNAITDKTKAIMPVDFGGLPCDYQAINNLVASESIQKMFSPSSEIQEKLGRIMVISDAAHSLGAQYMGKSVGNHADLTVFSFHAVKNLTTAEGGAVAMNLPKPFDNDSVYSDLRLMTLNCQTKDAFSKSQAGSWRYDIKGLGMKINMPDLNAALGLGQLRIYDKLLARRKEIFSKYAEGFADQDWFTCPVHEDEKRSSSYHLFPLRIKGINETQRDAIIVEITKYEVAVNVHFLPLPMLSYFSSLGYDISNFPSAYKNYSCEISLPLYPQLTDGNIGTIINSVKNAYNTVINSKLTSV